MKKLILPAIFVTMSLLLSSCGLHLGLSSLLGKKSPSSASAQSVKVTRTPSTASAISINNGKFRPKNVSVKVGTTITWTNNDDTQQTVTSDKPGVFDSGPLAPGATWKFTFTQAGLFPYHSNGTSGSYGSVTVTP